VGQPARRDSIGAGSAGVGGVLMRAILPPTVDEDVAEPDDALVVRDAGGSFVIALVEPVQHLSYDLEAPQDLLQA